MVKTKDPKRVTKKELKRIKKREINKKDKEWREKVKTRDKKTCQICGRTDIIHCHHILPRENKEYRWNIHNGICLCPKHHKFSREISAHMNSFIFVIWLQRNKKQQIEKLFETIIKYKEVKN